MKIKVLALAFVMFIVVALTGCAYNDSENNIKNFKDFLNKIFNFNQDDGSGDSQNDNQEQGDYLTQFLTLIEDGKFFAFERNMQTEYTSTKEEIYFLGSYIYKVTENASTVAHKLYLESGLTYFYDGFSVIKDKSVDFNSLKNQILGDLFNDAIVWEKSSDGYVYKSSDSEYFLTKGENENSLNYEIRYSLLDAWVIYKGEITIIDALPVEMPKQLNSYI